MSKNISKIYQSVPKIVTHNTDDLSTFTPIQNKPQKKLNKFDSSRNLPMSHVL